MFWGLNLKPNRKYTQTATKSFHISQAALDVDSAQDGANQIFITCENQKFLVCTLRKGAIEQVMLDYNFAEGDEISFQSVGSGNVSLSGYLIIDEDPMNFMNGGDDEEEEAESEVELEDLRNTLNKKSKKTKAALKTTVAEDDDEDEDDSDFDELTADAEGDEVSEEDTDDNVESDDDDDDDEEDEEDDDDEEEDEEEEVQQPKAKQPKLDLKSQKQQNGVSAKDKAAAASAESKKGKKKEKQQPQQQQQQQKQPQAQKAAGGERTITGGVKVEDVRVGNGPEAKTGKRAMVYYEGRLKSNNKVFDSLKQGSGFKFGLGRGEVIKGWDVGVVGMKVGGKRRITCPAHMAYGAKGAPPSIPPNSTLVFEVELKGVN